MAKITFLGAGSTVFVKNVLGDVMLTESLQGFELALFDIDMERLKDSENLLNSMKQSLGSTCVVKAYSNRKEALRGAKYVINAIQVGVMTLARLPILNSLKIWTAADDCRYAGDWRHIPQLTYNSGDARLR